MSEEISSRPRRRWLWIILGIVGLVGLCFCGLMAYGAYWTQTPEGEEFRATSEAERQVAQTAEAVAQVTGTAVANEQATGDAIATMTEAAKPTNTPTLTPVPSSTPEPTDTPIPTATSAPTNTPEPTGLSRQDPMHPGGVVQLERYDVSIERAIFPTDAFLERANMFNPSAAEGKALLMVYVTLTCNVASTETCSPDDSDFEAYGSAGIIHRPIINIVGVPDELDTFEFFGGATITGWVAFEVEADETSFVLAYEPFLSDAAYLLVPDPSVEN
ncbi:MAG: hypothetical protein H6658_02270 [Ardenticatenaceae bacterium]|nr:hypothetical protein [Ardenticatenaceae bacterium]